MAQPIGGNLFSAAECATYCATSRRKVYSRRPSAQPKAQPIGGAVLFSAADGEDDEDDKDDDDDDDDNRHYDETQSGRGHTDGAQTGWTPKCARGYARFMLAVWAGGGAQAASCLVIWVVLGPS